MLLQGEVSQARTDKNGFKVFVGVNCRNFNLSFSADLSVETASGPESNRYEEMVSHEVGLRLY